MKKIHFFLAANILLLVFSGVAFAEGAEESELNEEYFWDQIIKLVNISLVVIVLFFLLRKPVKGFFQRRAAQIDESIDAAKKAREEAENRLKQIEEEVDRIAAKSAEIREVAVKEGELEKQRIIAEAKEEAARILKAAEQEIVSRKKAAKKRVKAYAADIAIEKAKEILQERLSEEDDRLIIEKTIKEIGGVQ